MDTRVTGDKNISDGERKFQLLYDLSQYYQSMQIFLGYRFIVTYGDIRKYKKKKHQTIKNTKQGKARQSKTQQKSLKYIEIMLRLTSGDRVVVNDHLTTSSTVQSSSLCQRPNIANLSGVFRRSVCHAMPFQGSCFAQDLGIKFTTSLDHTGPGRTVAKRLLPNPFARLAGQGTIRSFFTFVYIVSYCIYPHWCHISTHQTCYFVSKKLLCLDQFPCSPEVPRTPTFKSQDLNDYKFYTNGCKWM